MNHNPKAKPPIHITFNFRTGSHSYPLGRLHQVSDGPGPCWSEVWAYGPEQGKAMVYRNEAAKVAADYMARYCEGAKGGPHWPLLGTPSAKRMGARIQRAVERFRMGRGA